MPGVFDRLKKQIDDKQAEGGITALDLADLAPPLRKIMRLMLRAVELDRARLGDAASQLPQQERLAENELDSALDILTQQAWLTRIGEGKRAVYRVNLRRKAGSTLASGIWGSLDAKLKGSQESDQGSR